eukprot:800101-Pleurochrysis_carterae.AAC.2
MSESSCESASAGAWVLLLMRGAGATRTTNRLGRLPGRVLAQWLARLVLGGKADQIAEEEVRRLAEIHGDLARAAAMKAAQLLLA